MVEAENERLRGHNSWWKVRRSSVKCGDEAAVATARVWKGVWTVEGME